MNPDNLMTVVLLFTGIIIVPTVVISILAERSIERNRRPRK